MTDPLLKIPIAIVGMACRLPGADGLSEYWHLLHSGRDMATDMPPERLDRELYFNPVKGKRGRTYSARGAFVSERPLDLSSVPLTSEDLPFSDPCHQMLCEIAARAVRHAGYDPFHMPSQRCGVYVGHSGGSPLGGDVAYGTLAEETVDFLRDVPSFAQLPHEVQEQLIAMIVGNLRSRRRTRDAAGRLEIGAHGAAGLIAEALKLSGPQMTIDAACASSLVALALGCLALQHAEIETAIVGGASFNKCDSMILFSHAQSCTADRSRPFDNAADGLLSSEGYVALVLQPLARAIAEQRPIQAVIRGIGVSSDGRGKSLWAPRKEGQVEAMQRAYPSLAEAAKVGYVEAHATSTQVGDATEVSALQEFYGRCGLSRKIPIGSVKSNIGHTLETAGLAGLVKSVLAMQHGCVPPSINVQELNREIRWSELPFQVATQNIPWPRTAEEPPRRAAVNAFGIGGLNVHVVVDEYDPHWETPTTATVPQEEPIAIIGRGVILPGALNVNALQKLLRTGECKLMDAPTTRWRKRIGIQPNVAVPHAAPHARGGFIEGYEYDWRKYKIPPKQVAQANPLQFMLLDASRQALEEAGYHQRPFDQAHTSMVVGSAFGAEFGHQLQVGLRLAELHREVSQALVSRRITGAQAEQIAQELEERILAVKPALLDETGSFTASTLASRITKTLDLMGGAMAIDTSTCSALAALDAACGMLRSGSCSLVLCAGASRAMDLPSYELLALRGSLAGSNQPANRFTGVHYPGEGVAVVLLKRWSDAKRDGDHILGVIQHVHSRMLTTDEVADTAEVYNDPLLNQIGHTQSAQGLVSLVSATLQSAGAQYIVRTVSDRGLEYQARMVVGSELPTTPITPIPKPLMPSTSLETSSVQETSLPMTHARISPIAPTESWRVIRFGDAHRSALLAKLQAAKLQLHDSFHAPNAFSRGDTQRIAFVVSSAASWGAKLELACSLLGQATATAALEEQGIYVDTVSQLPRRMAWLFPGQGSQYSEMLHELICVSTAANLELQRANAWLAQHGYDSFGEMTANPATNLGHDVWTTQAAMLVADALMLAAIRERGIVPDVVCGHSYGEFAAMLGAGSWSLEQALRVTRARANAIDQSRAPQSGLVSVDAAADRIATLIANHGCAVFITHYNAPQQTVVGGNAQALVDFSVLLEAEGMNSRPLPVPRAFHTPLMADTQEHLRMALASEMLFPPRVPLLSSVTNRYVAEPAELRQNLVQQMIEPVRFQPLVERLAAEGVDIFIEVGPQQVLTRLARQTLAGREMKWIPTDHPKRSTEEMLLRMQAALETSGWENMRPAREAAPTVTSSLHSIEQYDATQARREKRRTTPAPVAPPVTSFSTLDQFDATSKRREGKRQQLETPEIRSTVPPMVAVEQPILAASPPVVNNVAQPPVHLERFLIDFVVEQTGYPAEMIDLDWDMEADLGIDSIKRAQLFGELREMFVLENSNQPGFSLDRFRTLRQVLEYLQQHSAVTSSAQKQQSLRIQPVPKIESHVLPPAESRNEVVSPTVKHSASDANLAAFLINFVVEQTGYPAEIVELDADLEADLGIDSIKKAQLFGELREHFTLPVEKMGRVKLADYHTLRQVMNLLIEYLPELAVENTAVATTLPTPTPMSPSSAPVVEVMPHKRLLPTGEEVLSHTPEYLTGYRLGESTALEIRAWLQEQADRSVESGAIDAQLPVKSAHKITEALRGQAAGAGVHVANILAYEQAMQTPVAGNGNGNGHAHDAVTPSTTTTDTIASRYVLRMKESPQPTNSPSQPTWHGAALILGNNDLAQAMKQRLEQEGCRTYIVTPTQDAWSAANELERLWHETPILHLFIVTPRDAAARTTLDGIAWRQNRVHGLMTPFWLCQRWLKLVAEAGHMNDATLLATVSLGGDFGLSGNVVAAEGGAVAGLIKAISIESWVNGFRATPIKVLDAPADMPATEIVAGVWRELAVPSYDTEISLLHGRRHVIRAERQPLEQRPITSIRNGSVWICTGGARGITSYVAKELGQRFQLQLQLLGTAPEPNIPAAWRSLDDEGLKALKLQVMQEARAAGKNPIKAWQNTEKALEIDRTLREFSALGIRARYYSCDVADRSALSRVLDQIRAEVGPPEAILHGAGIGKDARFDRKEPEKVEQCFAAKIDGALALMDLTRRDHIKHFIAFGSISGRFGANGHTDYSAANDMLCKLVDWYRTQRPKTHAVAFHWHAWGDVGMATKPETKLALELVDMQFMPAREGLQHLLNELAAGTPEGEVLITDDRYHRMFYPTETLSDSSSAGHRKFPFLDAARCEQRGTQHIAEITLDPMAEPFLMEHRLEDRPLLPVVIGMEILAEAAAKQAGAKRVVTLENVFAINGLRFFQDHPQTIRVSTQSCGTDQWQCELTADFHARDGRLVEAARPYLRGDVKLANESEVISRQKPVVADVDWQNVDYAPRGEKFYLGPPLRALKQIKAGHHELWGRISPPMLQELAGRRRSADGWIIPSAALDACLYAVGLLAWMQVRPGASLPFSFGRIALGRLPQPGEACLVEARFLRQVDRYADFDFTLFGVTGDVILDVTDYRIVYLV